MLRSSFSSHKQGQGVQTAYIKLRVSILAFCNGSQLTFEQSVPLPLSDTFAQYAQLTKRLRKHYLSPRVFLCLVSGQFVPPIHRKNLYSLQYSMLPVRRVGIGELWKLLNEDGEITGWWARWADGEGNGHIGKSEK